MSWLVKELAAVPAWVLLAMVFLLPALEASTLLGLVVPGETVVLLGGVFAHQGRVPLSAVMAAAVLGAVTGDNIGYVLGERLGPALFSGASDRVAPHLAKAAAFVQRFGGAAVLLGRWAAFLRALVPSVAGASGLPYRRFIVSNLAGGAIWGVAVATVGFVAAASWARAEHALGLTGMLIAVLLLVVAVLSGRYLSRRAGSGEHHTRERVAG
jgi:membrane-associated protein